MMEFSKSDNIKSMTKGKSFMLLCHVNENNHNSALSSKGKNSHNPFMTL